MNPAPEFTVTVTAHTGCDTCDRCVDDAIIMAKATGSTGATYRRDDCTATVTRGVTPVRSYA